MAKHNGTVIRIGAAYDTVQFCSGLRIDRAALHKRKLEGDKDAKEELYQLRKGIVDAYAIPKPGADRRRQRRAQKGYANANS